MIITIKPTQYVDHTMALRVDGWLVGEWFVGGPYSDFAVLNKCLTMVILGCCKQLQIS